MGLYKNKTNIKNLKIEFNREIIMIISACNIKTACLICRDHRKLSSLKIIWRGNNLINNQTNKIKILKVIIKKLQDTPKKF